MRHLKSCWLMLLITQSLELTSSSDECRESRWGRHGPPIRFPFQRNHIDPDSCGYPGFDLTCHEHHTLLEIPAVPLPIQFRVNHINYNYRYLSVSDPENCLPRKLLKLNHTQFLLSNLHRLHINQIDPTPINEFSCPYVAALASGTLLDSGLISCTRMSNTISSSSWSKDPNHWILWWFKPDCSEGKARGKLCKLKNNGTEDAVQCYDLPPKPISKILYAAIGVPVGSAVLVLLFFALFQIYHHFRIKGEDQARVENFLEDYRAFRTTRFSCADIYRITNHLKDKLGERTHGAVFKGKLSKEISVAVKILNNMEGDGTEFINEEGTMARIHHVNVARMLGFCADGFHRALDYDFLPNGLLRNYKNPPDRENFLDVLLDDNFISKIIDFGLTKLCSKIQNTVSITIAAKGTLGYIAPEVLSKKFGSELQM